MWLPGIQIGYCEMADGQRSRPAEHLPGDGFDQHDCPSSVGKAAAKVRHRARRPPEAQLPRDEHPKKAAILAQEGEPGIGVGGDGQIRPALVSIRDGEISCRMSMVAAIASVPVKTKR